VQLLHPANLALVQPAEYDDSVSLNDIPVFDLQILGKRQRGDSIAVNPTKRLSLPSIPPIRSKWPQFPIFPLGITRRYDLFDHHFPLPFCLSS
jgi:hypothetical protein